MPPPPELIDRALWLHRRARRRLPGAEFLHAAALDSLRDRLAVIPRAFPRAALVWPGDPAWKAALEVHPAIGTLQVADPDLAEVLPLDEASADLIVIGLTLHWANDPVGVLIQCRRALAPDGLLLAFGLGGATLAELRQALAEAEAAEEGGLSPRVHPMADLRVLGALLQRAGFAMPVADADRIEVHYSDALALMRDLRAMAETNALHARRRAPLRRATLARAAAVYADRFPAPQGRVRAGFEICTLTGWAPGPDQPRPKRPGSATARLADALGAVERPAGEKAGAAPAGDGPAGGRGGR